MSNEPIQAGDLVIVKRAYCACCDHAEGRIAEVEHVSVARIICPFCLKERAPLGPVAFLRDSHYSGYMPLSHLRRIPPLAELETEETAEGVPA